MPVRWRVTTPLSPAEKLAPLDYFFTRRGAYYYLFSKNGLYSKSDEFNEVLDDLNTVSQSFVRVGFDNAKYVLYDNVELSKDVEKQLYFYGLGHTDLFFPADERYGKKWTAPMIICDDYSIIFGNATSGVYINPSLRIEGLWFSGYDIADEPLGTDVRKNNSALLFKSMKDTVIENCQFHRKAYGLKFENPLEKGVNILLRNIKTSFNGIAIDMIDSISTDITIENWSSYLDRLQAFNGVSGYSTYWRNIRIYDVGYGNATPNIYGGVYVVVRHDFHVDNMHIVCGANYVKLAKLMFISGWAYNECYVTINDLLLQGQTSDYEGLRVETGTTKRLFFNMNRFHFGRTVNSDGTQTIAGGYCNMGYGFRAVNYVIAKLSMGQLICDVATIVDNTSSGGSITVHGDVLEEVY